MENVKSLTKTPCILKSPYELNRPTFISQSNKQLNGQIIYLCLKCRLKISKMSKQFSVEDKRKLAMIIKTDFNLIWDLNNKLHHHNHALIAAWKSIAKEMDSTGEHMMCYFVF